MIRGNSASNTANRQILGASQAMKRNAMTRGRRGDTVGIFKDRSLLSGPMYRSQNLNTKLGV